MKFYLKAFALVLFVVNLDIKAVAKPKKYLIETEDGKKVETEDEEVMMQERSAMTSVAAGNAIFGLRLYNKIREEDKNNLLMSPYSLSSVMAMLSVGARKETMKEIMEGMNFPEMETLVEGYSEVFALTKGSDNFTLETANRVYVKEGFQMMKDFVKTLEESFNSVVTPVDFTANGGEVARKDINDWVEEKTNEKIKELIPENMLDGSSKLVLVNAISFKAEWINKFYRNLTEDEDFYVNANKTVKVKMMHILRKYFKITYIQDLDSHLIELPYEGNQVSMYIILPKEKFGPGGIDHRAEDVDKWYQKLNKETVPIILSKLEKEKAVYVRLSLPKFKLEKTIEMNEIMKKLGMTHMFTDMADFSGITQEEKLKVSGVFHKAFIEVNEEGSEANAASAVTLGMMAEPNPPKTVDFVCNHPFLFFTMDKRTNMILFSGRVVDPTMG